MSAKEEAQNEQEQEVKEQIQKLSTVNEKVKAVALNSILDKKKELDEQLDKEIKALTLKYDKLSQPLYQQSSEIISGKRAVQEDEITKVKEFLNEEEQKQLETAQTNQDAIQDYWYKALQNNDIIGAEIKEKDVEILKHITNIEYIPEDNLKFQVVFTFSENEFFSNTTLTKSFVLADDDEPLEGKGTEIQWKEGKNVTVKTVKKTQKNKKSGQKRVVTKEVPDESFFQFFNDHIAAQGEVDEDDEEQLQEEELLSIDFDIGRSLVDEVIPYSLEYFLGIKRNDDEYGMGDYDDEMGEQDDEDDDDDEDDQPKKSKKKAHKKSTDSNKSNEGAANKEKPECKQQ